ncbi:hypothetical protein [Paenibacillus sp. GCM10023250]|uniref:hypothetical protein n=1 Tax=Paenibacillus sp. GCM10023250 TaxID=3252648 RepID=UPI003610FF9E
MGWIFGPILFAGEDKTLLPENFRLLPVTPHRLATGLLGASLFGVPALISLLAFSTLFVYALQSGGLPSAIAAIPAVLLQLLFTVSISRVVTSMLRKLVRSQASSFFSSMITGAIMAFFVTGWLLLNLDTGGLANGLPTGFSLLLYAVPTNWGLNWPWSD